jgi:oxysterol-binding protein-related protein 9/10/11
VEMSFSGSLNVKQTGHAMLHIDKYDEDYLIPMIDFKIKGILSGRLYPELSGIYHIISSTGFVSEISFSGQGFFSGVKNSFEAKIYHREDETKSPIYIASGQWSGEFTIRDPSSATDIDTYSPGSIPPAPLHIPDLAYQDPWETRNAWKDVLTALGEGDMQRIVNEKSKLEEAQRAMRKKEIAQGIKWEPKFFSSTKEDSLFDKLASATGWQLYSERTKGVWKFDTDKAKLATKPYRGELTPFG